MALWEAPWLSDTIRQVTDSLDQIESDFVAETFTTPEIVRQAVLEHEQLITELSLEDEFYNVTTSNLSVTVGASSLSLPSDCKNVLAVYKLDSAGNCERDPIPFSDQHEWGHHQDDPRGVLVLQPLAGTLKVLGDITSATTFELVYEQYQPPPCHGIAQGGDSTTLTLAAHESDEDDIYNGLTIRIYSGTGAGQEREISDYDGSTKVATLSSSWTTTPVGDSSASPSLYTSRPSGLPREAANAFKYGLESRLAQRLSDEEYQSRMRDRALAIETYLNAVSARSRQRVDVMRNDGEYHFAEPHRRGFWR